MILLFIQHLGSTLKFKRGWWHLRTSVSSGKKPTPFIPLTKKLADETAIEINGTQYGFHNRCVDRAIIKTGTGKFNPQLYSFFPF